MLDTISGISPCAELAAAQAAETTQRDQPEATGDVRIRPGAIWLCLVDLPFVFSDALPC